MNLFDNLVYSALNGSGGGGGGGSSLSFVIESAPEGGYVDYELYRDVESENPIGSGRISASSHTKSVFTNISEGNVVIFYVGAGLTITSISVDVGEILDFGDPAYVYTGETAVIKASLQWS